MDHQKLPAATKRKGSPFQARDDVSPKRAKTDGEQTDSLAQKSFGNGTAGSDLQPSSAAESAQDERDGQSRKSSLIEEKPAETLDTPALLPFPRKKVEGKNVTARSAQVPQGSLGPSGRTNVTQEEKKRGQRLFGGLLSTLSQTAPRSQQKKRLEMERRQSVKAEQQRSEDDKRREERLAKLRSRRKAEQATVDEQVMNLRHSNMLAMAHSLHTKAEPRLYYLPYELTTHQGVTIKRQVQEAEEIIEKETMELKQRKDRGTASHGAARLPAGTTSARPVGDTYPARYTNLLPPSKTPSEKDNDEGGDEIVQDTEDTVLY